MRLDFLMTSDTALFALHERGFYDALYRQSPTDDMLSSIRAFLNYVG